MRDRVHIRAGKPDDAATLTAIARRAKASWGYDAAWLDQWHDELAFSEAYLHVARVWVAEVEGAPAGVLALEPRPDGWSIDRLWVEPDAQGLGIGRALVECARAAAAESRGELDVLSDPYAEAFYLKLGARRAGEVSAPMPGAPDRVLPRLVFDR